MAIENVTALLGQIVSGELTTDEIEYIHNSLLAGVDILSFLF